MQNEHMLECAKHFQTAYMFVFIVARDFIEMYPYRSTHSSKHGTTQFAN